MTEKLRNSRAVLFLI